MSHFRNLVASGLTNLSTGISPQEIISRSTRAVGICRGNGLKACAFRTTKRNDETCPKCGHYLYWTRETKPLDDAE